MQSDPGSSIFYGQTCEWVDKVVVEFPTRILRSWREDCEEPEQGSIHMYTRVKVVAGCNNVEIASEERSKQEKGPSKKMRKMCQSRLPVSKVFPTIWDVTPRQSLICSRCCSLHKFDSYWRWETLGPELGYVEHSTYSW